MPYNQSKTFKRRLPHKGKKLDNPYKKRSLTQRDFARYAGYAYSGLKLAKYLKSIVNVEKKHFDKTMTGWTIDTTGTINTLNDVPQGDTDITRDGDSLKLLKLQLRVQLTANASADNNVRVILFWDDQNEISASTDLLENGGTATAPWSYKNYDKRFKSKILYDKRFILTSSVDSTKFAVIDQNIPLYRHTTYAHSSTTINSGALKLLIIGGSTTNLPTASAYSRIIFVDN